MGVRRIGEGVGDAVAELHIWYGGADGLDDSSAFTARVDEVQADRVVAHTGTSTSWRTSGPP